MVKEVTLKKRIEMVEERVNDLGTRIVAREEADELRSQSDRGYHYEIAELVRRLDAFENPVDDRKEVRELQIGLRRLETMVRGIVDREQDRTLGKPVNPGSVSIHAEALAQRLVDVANEERDKAVAYLQHKALINNSEESILDFAKRIALDLQRALHR